MAETTEFNNSKENLITRIRKRDGRVVDFGKSKISNAIYKALVATGKPDYRLTETLSDKVMQKMVQHGYASTEVSAIPSVEDVQDIVESILIEEGLSDTAKSYILYRHERKHLPILLERVCYPRCPAALSSRSLEPILLLSTLQELRNQ